MNPHQQNRINLWINVATSVAGATNTINPQAPGIWANNVLKDFDEAFPAPEEIPCIRITPKDLGMEPPPTS